MFFRRLTKFRGSLVLASVPTSARPAEVSKSLAEKYDAQVKWMRERGITGSLGATLEQSQNSARPASADLVRPNKSEQ